MRGAFTDAKQSRARAVRRRPARARSSSTRSARCRSRCRSSCCACCRSARSARSAATRRSPFDARVITATNRDLETEVEEKRFREDLYYRINVVAIHGAAAARARPATSWCSRSTSSTQIAKRIKKPVQGISAPRGARCWSTYDWPGNVRELENCMERAVALCRLDEITVEDLPDKLQRAPAATRRDLDGVAGGADHARRDGAALRAPGARRGRRQQDARRAHPRHRSPLAVPPARAGPAAGPRRGRGCDRRRRATRRRPSAPPRPDSAAVGKSWRSCHAWATSLCCAARCARPSTVDCMPAITTAARLRERSRGPAPPSSRPRSACRAR